jgi:hypothetical protein
MHKEHLEAKVLEIFPTITQNTFDFGRGGTHDTSLINQTVLRSVMFGTDGLEKGLFSSQNLHSRGRVPNN